MIARFFLLRLVPKAESSDDTVRVPNTAHERVYRLAGRRYHIFYFGRRLGILAGPSPRAESRQNCNHLPLRIIPLFMNAIWT